MPVRTDDELKQLARDMVQGRVFSDLVIEASSDEEKMDIVRMVWPILLFLNEKQQQEVLAAKPVVLYEYLTEAGPRSVNGYPMFMSIRMVSAEEWPRLESYLQRLLDAPDPLAEEA